MIDISVEISIATIVAALSAIAAIFAALYARRQFMLQRTVSSEDAVLQEKLKMYNDLSRALGEYMDAANNVVVLLKYAKDSGRVDLVLEIQGANQAYYKAHDELGIVFTSYYFLIPEEIGEAVLAFFEISKWPAAPTVADMDFVNAEYDKLVDFIEKMQEVFRADVGIEQLSKNFLKRIEGKKQHLPLLPINDNK